MNKFKFQSNKHWEWFKDSKVKSIREKYDQKDPETVVNDPTELDKTLCRVGIDPREVRIGIWETNEKGVNSTNEGEYDGPTWDHGGDLEGLTNGIGLSLSDVRTVSNRLNELLELLNPQSRYRSISEADMNTVYLLRGWHFAKDDITRILRDYRDRKGRTDKHPEKRQRTDYAPRTVAAASGRIDPIDPPLAHALVKSAKKNNGQGPKASRPTITIVWGKLFDAVVESEGEPVTTSDVTEWSPFDRQRTRRALNILGDAGYIDRKKGHEYRWSLGPIAPLSPWIQVTQPNLNRLKVENWPYGYATV